MDFTAVVQTLLGGLLGGGLIGFIEFMIRRHDEKENSSIKILYAIDNLDKKIEHLNKKIDDVERKGDERNTVEARVRILKFADELMEERRHSKDSWDQCLSDITTYEDYCKAHEDFKNNQTAATVAFIKKGYSERLEKHDFL